MGPSLRLKCLLYSIIKILESYTIEDGVMCCFVYMILVKQGWCCVWEDGCVHVF